MNIGKIVEKLLHKSNNSHIQSDDEKFNVKNLTPAQLNELLILNQLSPQEFLSLPNSKLLEQRAWDPLIDGGYKKRKTERKRIRKKKRIQKTKRIRKTKRNTKG